MCWWFGVAGSLTGAILFIKSNLYSESLLYFFYAFMGVWGWIVWNAESGVFRIKGIAIAKHIMLILVGALSWIALGYGMSFTDADKPFYDAFSTVFSVIATFLEIYKILGAFIYWIIINAFSIWLYGSKELNYYLFLAAVYTAISIYGAIEWQRTYREQSKNI